VSGQEDPGGERDRPALHCSGPTSRFPYRAEAILEKINRWSRSASTRLRETAMGFDDGFFSDVGKGCLLFALGCLVLSVALGITLFLLVLFAN
jgi:hypothetical protein